MVRRREMPKDIYRGHEYERDLVHGIFKTEKYGQDFQQLYLDFMAKKGISETKALARAQEEIKEKGLIYLPYDLAIKLVKKNQPWTDPTNPDKSFFGNVLRSAIIDELDISDPDQMDKIKFYTATSREKKPQSAYSSEQELAADHTPLDWYYGIDCFIEIGGNGDKIGTIIPLDLSLDRKKINPKAIIISEIDIPERDEPTKKFLDEVENIAQQVVAEIPDKAKKELSQ